MFNVEQRNLMFDLGLKREIYDVETNRAISNSEASDKIREFCLVELGLNEKSTERDIKRALKKPEAQQLFQIIEEILDVKIVNGWQDNEFFNKYVENRNLADGDMNEFYTENDIILHVARVSGDHHDLDYGVRIA